MLLVAVAQLKLFLGNEVIGCGRGRRVLSQRSVSGHTSSTVHEFLLACSQL